MTTSSARRSLLPALFMGLLCSFLLPSPSAAASAVAVTNGGRGAPMVALTFDDASSNASLESIFATLQATGAPATFFPTAANMASTPGLWQAIAAAGHPIGSHTQNHPQLTTLSDDRIASEIANSTATITSITGQAPINMLRPPYGAYDARVAAIAAASGYSILALWDIDPRDWSGISAADIVARTVPTALNGSIILLHAGPNNTAAALPQIIDGLRARGFALVTLPQLLGGGAPVAPPPPVLAPIGQPVPAPISPPAAPLPTPAPTPPPPTPLIMHMASPVRPISTQGLDGQWVVVVERRPSLGPRFQIQ